MGAVNTTYTFTATDTITSTKMNDIIDQTTFTNDAVFDTTLAVAAGKLKVNSQGITSNELAAGAVLTSKIVDANVTTEKIADSTSTTTGVTTAKIANANITQVKLATNVVGNGPVFRAYATAGTSCPPGVYTKVLFGAEDFDTNLNFDSSRFTPTIAGYYSVTSCVCLTAGFDRLVAAIYKNGSIHSNGATQTSGVGAFRTNVSDVVYLNGSTDYVEVFLSQSSGSNGTTQTGTANTYFSGCLIRSA